jgi:hypothetical protein
MMKPHEKIIYAVWNPRNGSPTKQYSDMVDAVKESERLARENAGQSFYVMQSIGISHKPREEQVYTSLTDDGVPF